MMALLETLLVAIDFKFYDIVFVVIFCIECCKNLWLIDHDISATLNRRNKTTKLDGAGIAAGVLDKVTHYSTIIIVPWKTGFHDEHTISNLCINLLTIGNDNNMYLRGSV